MLLAAIFMGTIFSLIPDSNITAGMGISIAVLYLVIAALYFFPVFYLFNFSVKSKKAVQTGDSNVLSEAIKNLKSHFLSKYLGQLCVLSNDINGMYR